MAETPWLYATRERALGQAALFMRSRFEEPNKPDRPNRPDRPTSRHTPRNGSGTLFCPQWLVWRLEVQLVAPVAKAESRREFTLATKPERFVEVLGAGHQFTCEEADDLR